MKTSYREQVVRIVHPEPEMVYGPKPEIDSNFRVAGAGVGSKHKSQSVV